MIALTAMKKRVFITGGLGYIGSAFAKKALKKGYEIMLYDSLIYEQDYEKIMKEVGPAELVIGDTRNTALLKKSLERFKPNYLLHLGELSSVYMCDHNPRYSEDINCKASRKVIDICSKMNISVLYNSTSSLYGNQKDMRLMTEKDPVPKTTDNYCKYKLKMEEYITKKTPEKDILSIL